MCTYPLTREKKKNKQKGKKPKRRRPNEIDVFFLSFPIHTPVNPLERKRENHCLQAETTGESTTMKNSAMQTLSTPTNPLQSPNIPFPEALIC